MKHPQLNLPPIELKLKEENNILKIFDPLRKKYVALTPEEYVRQHFISMMAKMLHYPPSLTSNEVSIKMNGMSRRCDTVVFQPNGTPLLIVEYKAPDVKITQDTFDQIVRYNMVLKARYLVVSNGLTHYCCAIDYANNRYDFIPQIPDYNDLRNPFSLN